MYDQTGSTDGNQFSGFENEDIFNAFRGGFGGQNPRGGMGGGSGAGMGGF